MYDMVKENLLNAVKAGRKGLNSATKASKNIAKRTMDEVGEPLKEAYDTVKKGTMDYMNQHPMQSAGIAAGVGAGAGAIGVGIPANIIGQQQGQQQGQQDEHQAQMMQALQMAVTESVDPNTQTLSWSTLHKNLAKINPDAAQALTIDHVSGLAQELGVRAVN